MNVQASAAQSIAPSAPAADKPRTTEEAAKQFEQVFVRQFVQVMTKDLFDSESSEGALVSGQSDMQRDILTDTLTDHLVESGALRLSDLLLRQWSSGGESAPAQSVPAEPAPAAPTPTIEMAPARSSFWDSFGNGYTPPADERGADTE